MRHSLWIKPKEALNSSFIGITTLHVSGSLSAHHQEFLAVHRYWYILCSFEDRCYQFDDRLLPGAGAPGASFGFIHKEFVMMHGDTTLKCHETVKLQMLNSWRHDNCKILSALTVISHLFKCDSEELPVSTLLLEIGGTIIIIQYVNSISYSRRFKVTLQWILRSGR